MDPNTSYSDFCEGLQAYILANAAELKGRVTAYAYQGFSPRDVFKTLLQKMNNARLTEENARKDVIDMLIIFFARGPNMAKTKIDTIKGGGDAHKSIEELIKRYDIKSSKPKSSDITLPHLCMIFGGIAKNLYQNVKDNILNYPVTEGEIGLHSSQEFSYNLIARHVLSSRKREKDEWLYIQI